MPAVGQSYQPRWDWAISSTGTSLNEWTTQVVPVATGGSYVSGQVEGVNNQQIGFCTLGSTVIGQDAGFLARLDAAGQWLWAVELANGTIVQKGMVVDPATDDLIVTGSFRDTLRLGAHTLVAAVPFINQPFVARLSATGQWLWAAVGQIRLDSQSEAVALSPAGDVIVAGTMNGDSLQLGALLVRNPHLIANPWSQTGFVASLAGGTGQWQWASQVGGLQEFGGGPYSNGTGSHRVAVSPQGTVLVSGNCASTTTVTYGTHTYPGGPYIVRLSATGQWLGAAGSPAASVYSIAELTTDAAGNGYVTGFAFDNQQTGTLYAARLSAAGQWQWIKFAPDPYVPLCGGMISQRGSGIAADGWGNVYVAAAPEYTPQCATQPSSRLPSTYVNVYRLNAATGAIDWNLPSSPGSAGWASAASLSVDDQGNAFLAGGYSGSTTQFGATTMPPPSPWGRMFVAKLVDPEVRARVLGVAVGTPTSSLSLHPNPARSTAQLTLAAVPAAPVAVRLLDNVGRVVRTQTASQQALTLDLQGLPAGLYTVRAGTSHQQLVVE